MTTPFDRIQRTPLIATDIGGRSARVATAADKYTVAVVADGMTDRPEYARLFAAAPRMRALLLRAHSYLSTYSDNDVASNLLKSIEQVLADAEGLET